MRYLIFILCTLPLLSCNQVELKSNPKLSEVRDNLKFYNHQNVELTAYAYSPNKIKLWLFQSREDAENQNYQNAIAINNNSLELGNLINCSSKNVIAKGKIFAHSDMGVMLVISDDIHALDRVTKYVCYSKPIEEPVSL